METPAKAKKKVLIVEDDALLLVTLSHQFEDAGYEIVTASDGEEGLASFFRERPDAVVLDVMMPRKDGIEMLEEIREKEPNDRTPFVVLSNANDTDYVSRAMDSGAMAYLLKSDRQIDSIVKLIEDKMQKG